MLNQDECSIDFTQTKQDDGNNQNTLSRVYLDAITKSNQKATNLEGWSVNESTYLINSFLKKFEQDRIAIFDFNIDQKDYVCKYNINNTGIEQIVKDFFINKNKKNAYSYSSKLSNQLFDIFVDYLDKHIVIKIKS